MAERKASATGLVLLTLCAGQFLMMLDSSVMNVSMATVAKDLDTTVTGIQTAITLYTLVMASFMITGGKIGQIIGRKRAFAIGCIVYGCGSLVTALSPKLGVGLIVFGVLRSGTWGLVQPKPDAPEWFGLSPCIWLILGGGVVLSLFLAWENRRLARGSDPLVDPKILRIPLLRGGLTSFFFQYFLQGGLFFAVPLFLSVALGLSAIDTGVRLLPLSITLILAAAGIPKLFPDVSPRRVVRLGFLALLVGLVVLVAALDAGAGPDVVTWPMLLAGLGVGALASQLGSVTVASLPDEQSGEVGGLQNTITNLGISVGTALTGAIVIATLTTSFLTGVEQNPAVPASVKSQASTELAGGVPFISDEDLKTALDDAHVPPSAADAIVDENETARIDGLRSALPVLAALALVALFFSRRIPTEQPAATTETAAA